MRKITMNRREAVQRLGILAGGIWLMKSCSLDSNGASIELDNYKMTKQLEEVLSAVVQTILPLDGQEPEEIRNLHLFVMKMVDDCHDQTEQQVFTDSLADLVKGEWHPQAKPFISAPAEERTRMVELLNRLDDNQIKKCYEIIKRRTIQGYNNSAYLMKTKGTYELIPGRYNGYAKV